MSRIFTGIILQIGTIWPRILSIWQKRALSWATHLISKRELISAPKNGQIKSAIWLHWYFTRNKNKNSKAVISNSHFPSLRMRSRRALLLARGKVTFYRLFPHLNLTTLRSFQKVNKKMNKKLLARARKVKGKVIWVRCKKRRKWKKFCVNID